MMGIKVPETCWAYYKCNKPFSSIQLVFLLYAYATMHGQTHIKSMDHVKRYTLCNNAANYYMQVGIKFRHCTDSRSTQSRTTTPFSVESWELWCVLHRQTTLPPGSNRLPISSFDHFITTYIYAFFHKFMSALQTHFATRAIQMGLLTRFGEAPLQGLNVKMVYVHLFY